MTSMTMFVFQRPLLEWNVRMVAILHGSKFAFFEVKGPTLHRTKLIIIQPQVVQQT